MARNGLLIDMNTARMPHLRGRMQAGAQLPCGEMGYQSQRDRPRDVRKDCHRLYSLSTDLCNLCVQRTKEGIPPACVKHCQAGCMTYGPVQELAKVMEKKPKTVLFAPK